MTINRNLSVLAENASSAGVLQPAGGGTGTAGTSVILNGGTIGAGNATSFKNRIINGAMTIDQRNAGASVTPTVSTYILDRWQFQCTQASKVMLGQGSGISSQGLWNSLNASVLTTVPSPGATDYFAVRQAIEGFNVADLSWGTASAQTVTLSFWVQASVTGTFGGSFTNNAINRSYPFSYTISATNTWQKISITIPGDTTGTWLINNGVGVNVYFSLCAGSTYSGTAGAWGGAFYASSTGATNLLATSGATFYITGVQLEVGSTATSFDVRDYGRELIMCQRYYQSISLFVNSTANPFNFATTTRAAPTVSSTAAGFGLSAVVPSVNGFWCNQTLGAQITVTVSAEL
jgi:hypothetical protein